MLIPAVLMSASEPFRESSLVISGMNKGEASRYPLLELDSYFGLLRLAPPRSQCARTCRTWQRQSRGLSRSAVGGLACLAIELIASRMTAVGRRTNLSRSTMILQLPSVTHPNCQCVRALSSRPLAGDVRSRPTTNEAQGRSCE